MTMSTTEREIEAMCDRRESRRFASDQRAWDKMGRQQRDADELVGELNGGKFYINQRSKNGRLTGRAVIFTSRSDACDFLIRNRYV